MGKVVAIKREDGTIDLEGGKWKAVNRLLGILAALQVAAFQGALWMKMAIIGNRKTGWASLVARIVAAPSRWLISTATRL